MNQNSEEQHDWKKYINYKSEVKREVKQTENKVK